MANKKRNITIVTGTRAEYGILKPVIEAVSKHKKLNLQLLITGQHMLRKFGYTYKEVEADNWPIVGKVRLHSERDDIFSHAQGMGKAITNFSKIYAGCQSDIVLVLGDRLEQFAATAAAAACEKIIAHIHGGDRATGINDDCYRHAITKLSHIHFAASDKSARRIERLGEDKYRIYRTGSPAIDGILKNICKSKKKLKSYVDFNIDNEFLIILFHPSGASAKTEKKRMKNLLDVCSCKSLHKLVLYPNCDTGHAGIIEAIDSVRNRDDYTVVRHLPRDVYLGLLTRSSGLVGNSSGGIVEASCLTVDVLDVGNRQAGRERSRSVIHCGLERSAIDKAVDKLLNRAKSGKQSKPDIIYGDGRSSQRIASILASVKLDDALRLKTIAY